MEFTIADLSRMVGVHRDSASKATHKLVKWNMLEKMEHGPRFRVNEEEPAVKALNAFNDSIMIHMFPEISDVLEDLSEDQDIENIESRRNSKPIVTDEFGE